MEYIIGRAVGVANATRKAIGPNLKVMFGVGANGRHTRGTAGHVNLAHLALGHGQHAIRIGIAQILLGYKRSLLQVIERLHGIRIEARIVKRLLIKRNVLVTVDDGLLDALDLNLFDLFVGHRQDILLFGHAIPSLPNSRPPI